MHYDLHPLVLPLLLLIAACVEPQWWEWETDRVWPRWNWILGRALGVFSVSVLAALWLACYYNLAFLRGAVRFPFETLVALGQWLVAGLWTACQYWPTGSSRALSDLREEPAIPAALLSSWGPNPSLQIPHQTP
jgi:hypothetical protein